MSCCNAKLPARKSETASWRHGMRGTAGPFATDDQEQSQCCDVLPTRRWWVENRGKPVIAGGIPEEHGSKAGYTAKANLEEVWAPAVHHTKRGQIWHAQVEKPPRLNSEEGRKCGCMMGKSSIFGLFFHFIHCCCVLAHGDLQRSRCWMMLRVLTLSPAK